MDRFFGFIAAAFMFLPWRLIVVLLAAIWFVNISGVELYDWRDVFAHGGWLRLPRASVGLLTYASLV